MSHTEVYSFARRFSDTLMESFDVTCLADDDKAREGLRPRKTTGGMQVVYNLQPGRLTTVQQNIQLKLPKYD
jgi:hypothetical protein